MMTRSVFFLYREPQLWLVVSTLGRNNKKKIEEEGEEALPVFFFVCVLDVIIVGSCSQRETSVNNITHPLLYKHVTQQDHRRKKK